MSGSDGEEKRGRGRPKKEGAKHKRIQLRVSDDFYEELKELSTLEGQTRTDYIINSIRAYSALTRARHTEEEENYEEDYMDFEIEDEDFYEN